MAFKVPATYKNATYDTANDLREKAQNESARARGGSSGAHYMAERAHREAAEAYQKAGGAGVLARSHHTSANEHYDAAQKYPALAQQAAISTKLAHAESLKSNAANIGHSNTAMYHADAATAHRKAESVLPFHMKTNRDEHMSQAAMHDRLERTHEAVSQLPKTQTAAERTSGPVHQAAFAASNAASVKGAAAAVSGTGHAEAAEVHHAASRELTKAAAESRSAGHEADAKTLEATAAAHRDSAHGHALRDRDTKAKTVVTKNPVSGMPEIAHPAHGAPLGSVTPVNKLSSSEIDTKHVAHAATIYAGRMSDAAHSGATDHDTAAHANHTAASAHKQAAAEAGHVERDGYTTRNQHIAHAEKFTAVAKEHEALHEAQKNAPPGVHVTREDLAKHAAPTAAEHTNASVHAGLAGAYGHARWIKNETKLGELHHGANTPEAHAAAVAHHEAFAKMHGKHAAGDKPTAAAHEAAASYHRAESTRHQQHVQHMIQQGARGGRYIATPSGKHYIGKGGV